MSWPVLCIVLMEKYWVFFFFLKTSQKYMRQTLLSWCKRYRYPFITEYTELSAVRAGAGGCWKGGKGDVLPAGTSPGMSVLPKKAIIVSFRCQGTGGGGLRSPCCVPV